MLTRGTTPYHNFTLPMKSEDISELYVTYLQNNAVVLEKSLLDDGVTLVDITDMYENGEIDELTPSEEEVSGSQLTVHLSQEDTLKFIFYPDAKRNIAVIQIRLVTGNGEAFASLPVKERVFGVLKDGVIGGTEYGG